MNIFLIGSGGREHAIAWKLLQSNQLKKLYLTSPTAAVEVLQQQEPHRVERVFLDEKQKNVYVDFSLKHKIDLVVIANESPLAEGLADQLRAAHVPVFGPSKAAAQIESSKAFSKNFMSRHRIPTARYAVFNHYDTALSWLSQVDYPVVIKASGLAAGKGVFLPHDLKEATLILKQLLSERLLNQASDEVVIEERLQGHEVSLLAFSDGVKIKVMPPARDYKRLLENNEGPNTGGMGAYAPVHEVTSEQIQAWERTILQPTIDGLRAENRSFVGVIYAGLMITADGPKVLEFNCRLGDPETQVLMPLLKSDLLEIMQACVNQRLDACSVEWSNQTALCVVMASQGYPFHTHVDDLISGLEKIPEGTLVFHAGTRQENNQVFTAGGRVLGVTACGDDVAAAGYAAYQAVSAIDFAGKQYRHDISK